MKAVLLNNQGIESFVVFELCKLLQCNKKDLKTELYSGAVSFEHNSYHQLFRLCYLSQSVSKVMSLVGSFECESDKAEHILEKISLLDFSSWLSKDTSLAVRTDIEVTDTSKKDFEAEAGSIIVKQTSCKVNLTTPDVLIFIAKRDSTVFVGVDFSGVDLAKRDYRIFTGRENVKAPVAAYANWKAGIEKGQIVIDPYCKNGTVVLECVHQLLNRSIHFFQKDKFLFTRMSKFSEIDFDELLEIIDKEQQEKLPISLYAIDGNFRHISAVKKNSKIAGVDKHISYSRTELDWIDTKFEKEQVHHIISFVPQISKTFSQKIIEKQYQELFYQASFVLHPTGNVVCISRESKVLGDYAEKYKFFKSYEQEIKQGNISFFVIVFEKKKSD